VTIRMTAPRLAALVEAGDAETVRTAVTDAPHLLGGTVERDGDDGWTPLHLAAAAGRAEVVRLLVEAGADPSARTEHGRTPLHVALRHHPPVVAVLRELGAVVDAPSAAYLDDVDQLRRELDSGAELDGPGTADLLSWAAHGGAENAARLLLERGADADAGALHAAAGRSRASLVRLLLDAGADVHRREPDTGRTPLHVAVTGGSGDAPEVVQALLVAGADVDATTSDGASPLDISRVAAARERREAAGRAAGHDRIAELLEAHGATS
jgi:ankyrin repeat protein